MTDIEEVGHRADRMRQNPLPLFEEDPDRTTIVLRDGGCEAYGLSQLLPSAEVNIPYKGYDLDSVDQYILVRMAETVSTELATKMMSAMTPSIGFSRIKTYLGDEYDSSRFSENSADIYCYMIEGYGLAMKMNEDLRKLLLSTGDAMILTYEHSWTNAQWGAEPIGIGDEEQVVWAGENIVGRALEAVRDSLRALGREGNLILQEEVEDF